jgi:hypothetical protein
MGAQMVRWALVRHAEIGKETEPREVRGYLDFPPVLTEADEDALVDARRRLAFGANDDGAAPLEPEGEWMLVPPASGLVGDGWRYEGGVFLPRGA